MPHTDLLPESRKEQIRQMFFSMEEVNGVGFREETISVTLKPGAPKPNIPSVDGYPVEYEYGEAFALSAINIYDESPGQYASRVLSHQGLVGRNWRATEYDMVMDDYWQMLEARSVALLPEQQGTTTENVPCRTCGHEILRGGIATYTTRLGGGYGTLGGMAWRASDGATRMISNYHVWCVSGFKRGDRVGHPYRSSDSARHIGKLVNWGTIKIRTEEVTPRPVENFVDCAAAELLDPSTQKRTAKIIDLGLPTGFAAPKKGDKIAKSGARTQTTYGTILSVDYAIKVNGYPIQTGGRGFAYFGGLIQTTPILTQGDSGSYLFNTTTKRVVGLCMGGGPGENSYACNIIRVKDALGVVGRRPTATYPSIQEPITGAEVDPIVAGVAIGAAGAFFL